MKICNVCKASKLIEEFSKRTTKKGTIIPTSKCKTCARQYSKNRYHKTPDVFRSIANQRGKCNRKKNQKYIIEYLSTHSCVDCNESDPIVLEFDHVRGIKSKDISRLISNYSLDLIIEEIKKCDVRCANCHRRRHAKDSNQIRFELTTL